ncbi:hypothetical protein MP638_006414 [Amoeboaphelidium occidentale]|nr:hypothetical protein MP638_006414 [Amoeboaphelidium occidentale]
MPKKSKSKKKESNESLSALKKELRSVGRLLRKTNVSRAVRVEKERLRDRLVLQVDEKYLKSIEKKYALKYKKVRFFEEKKAQRKLKQAEDNESVTEDELLDCKADVLYVQEFPQYVKYLSLYAEKGTSDDRKESVRECIKEYIKSKSALSVQKFLEDNLEWIRKEKQKALEKAKKASESGKQHADTNEENVAEDNENEEVSQSMEVENEDFLVKLDE